MSEQVVRERGIVKEYVLWLAKIMTILFLVVVIVPIFLTAAFFASGTALVEAPLGEKHAVAVVELKGAIENSKEVLENLYKHSADEKIKGIVLRIDSPGGAVAPSQDIYNAVKALKAKKPIVVSMGNVAASGGLYSAVSASKVYAQPGTLTGSIGVIMEVPNFTRIAERVGFDMVTLKSGKLKDLGNSFRMMTDEERRFLEDHLTQVHGQFITAVAEGRKLDPAKVRQFADGRILVGSEAKELGLVDEFGGIYDAARAVFDILGEPLKADEQPKLIYSHDKFEEFKQLLQSITKIPGIFSPVPEMRYEMR